MLRVLDRLLKICTSSESVGAVAALLRFLAILTHAQRRALEAVVSDYYGEDTPCNTVGPLMSASAQGNDYEMAALIMERMTASKVQVAEDLGERIAHLDLSSAAKQERPDPVSWRSPPPIGVQLASVKQTVRADKSLRPSRINEIRTWLLSLPKGSEVTYNAVAMMWYPKCPERAGSAFSQLCRFDKALKRVGHARYKLVRGAKARLTRGLKYFSGKKYRSAREKTLFD